MESRVGEEDPPSISCIESWPCVGNYGHAVGDQSVTHVTFQISNGNTGCNFVSNTDHGKVLPWKRVILEFCREVFYFAWGEDRAGGVIEDCFQVKLFNMDQKIAMRF